MQMIQIWMQQVEWTFCYCLPAYSEDLLRNQIHNFFIAYDTELQRAGLDATDRESHRARMLVGRFMELLSRNYKSHRDVKFYADQLCIATSYLNRLTNRVLGNSPKELIDGKIINSIKDTLATSDKSVKRIAAELHFPDASYMARYFTRHTGLTTTEFRTKHS